MKKYCTRCGKPFEAIKREVICPTCKQAAAEEAKRAAVLKAKLASWAGESVPVRISGRASTVIREYGAANNMPFAAALDALLKASTFFQSVGKAWEEVEPYRSHRRDKTTSTAETAIDEHLNQTAQDVPQDVKQDVPQDVKQDVPQDVKQAARVTKSATASKASASKTAASKATASKATASKASKASKAK